MALIKCPECGKDVSDTIENCIHCGFVLKKAETEEPTPPEKTCDDFTSLILSEDCVEEKQKSSIIKFLVCCVGVVFAFIIFAAIMSSVSSPVQTISQTTTVYTHEIDLYTVQEDFRMNRLTAREKYEGNRYISASIAVVDEIEEDYIIATVVPNNNSSNYEIERLYVKLYYAGNQYDFVRNLKKYDFVTFEGTLKELSSEIWIYFEDVVFIDCSTIQ